MQRLQGGRPCGAALTAERRMKTFSEVLLNEELRNGRLGKNNAAERRNDSNRKLIERTVFVCEARSRAAPRSSAAYWISNESTVLPGLSRYSLNHVGLRPRPLHCFDGSAGSW